MLDVGLFEGDDELASRPARFVSQAWASWHPSRVHLTFLPAQPVTAASGWSRLPLDAVTSAVAHDSGLFLFRPYHADVESAVNKEKEREETTIRLDLTDGRSKPPQLLELGPWPVEPERDDSGYPVFTASVADPGPFRVLTGFEGRVTLRLAETGSYTIVLADGDYELCISVESDDVAVSFDFDEANQPTMVGASYGTVNSPMLENGNHGMRLLEVKQGRRSDAHDRLIRTNLRLSPSLALVSRKVDIWIHSVHLEVVDIPQSPRLSQTFLCHTGAEIVLAPGVLSTSTPVGEIRLVRVLDGLELQPSKLSANVTELQLAPGVAFELQTEQTVRKAGVSQRSELRLPPDCAVGRVEAQASAVAASVSLVDFPPRLVVRSGPVSGFSRIGHAIGPLEIQMDAQRMEQLGEWAPARLAVASQLHQCAIRSTGNARIVSSLYLLSGAVATDIDFAQSLSSNPESAHVGLVLGQGSALHDAKGSVIVHRIRGATVEGSHASGLRIVDLTAEPRVPSGNETAHPDAIENSPSRLEHARMTAIVIDLESWNTVRLLEAARASQLFEPHPLAWNDAGRLFSGRNVATRSKPSENWLDRFKRSSNFDSAPSRQRYLGLELLAERTRTHARSGTVRSAVAHSNLVGRQRNSKHPAERILLLGGEFLGFGYRILLPLTVWIGFSLIAAALALADTGLNLSAGGIWNLIEGTLNVMAEPVSLVRGVKSETWLDNQLEEKEYLVTGLRVLVGLPFASAVVAVGRRVRSGVV